MSDLAIRNWFIIPTIVFLIVFNIFPLIYSLGFSFTDFSASRNKPAIFVGLQNYRELLTDSGIWNNFTITATYVVMSVAGQVIVGFGMALLLNRPIPGKGVLTTILMLPMMMSGSMVRMMDTKGARNSGEMSPSASMKPGNHVPVTLDFVGGEKVSVDFVVKSATGK